jgi:DNA repair exonuclease SbcCD ATPase subunit
MRNLPSLFIISIVILSSCTQSSKHDEHNHEAANTDNPNQALYDQVMDIHDEVMPRSEDIYQLKKELQEKVTSAPDLIAEKKQELESIIAQLDSADNSMMDWMHNFRPLPDSVDQEKARAYLESEMERIKKVRDLTNETIEKAKAFKK